MESGKAPPESSGRKYECKSGEGREGDRRGRRGAQTLNAEMSEEWRKDEGKSGDGRKDGRKRRKDECKSGDGRKDARKRRGWHWVPSPES